VLSQKTEIGMFPNDKRRRKGRGGKSGLRTRWMGLEGAGRRMKDGDERGRTPPTRTKQGTGGIGEKDVHIRPSIKTPPRPQAKKPALPIEAREEAKKKMGEGGAG